MIQQMLLGAALGSPPIGLADGDPVSSWTDSSGNGNHATMSGSNRPTFKTAIVNAKPVVRFTSAGQSKLNLTTPISGAFPWHVFTVMRPTPGGRLDSLDGSDGGAPRGPLVATNGSVYMFTREWYVGNSIWTPGFHVINGFNDGAASQFILVDGVVDTGVLTALVNTGNFSTIGYDSVAPVYCDGDIAEIIVAGVAFSVTNRQNIEKTLSVKYGTPATPGGSVIDLSTLPLQGWWKADSLLAA